MAIRTKAELLALYADNVTGDISADDLRDFVNSNQVNAIQTISSSPATINNLTDIAIITSGSSIVNLPSSSSYGNRTLVIINNEAGLLTMVSDGSDTIQGFASISQQNNRKIFIAIDNTGSNWLLLSDNQTTFLSSIDTPSTYSSQANKHVTVNGGETALVFTNAVDSFISRTGAVVAAASDYDASQVDNNSTVAGAFVDDALNQLDTDITAKPDDFLELTDTPSSFSGQGGNLLAVNGGETAVEFIAPSASTVAQFFEEANSSTTTITDLVTFEDIIISLAANSLNTLGDFSVSGNTLTKTTSGTSTYSVMWCFDCEPDTGNNRDYTIKAFKNGSTALDGRALVSITSTQPRSGQVFTLVSLAQNDTVDFKVRADSNTVDFISINNEIMVRLA